MASRSSQLLAAHGDPDATAALACEVIECGGGRLFDGFREDADRTALPKAPWR